MAESQSRALKPIDEVRNNINRLGPQFGAVLPPHIPVERFVRTVQTAVQTTPALLECDKQSLYGAAMKAAQDGLLPDGREGVIMPRKGKAAWMPMVAGIMKKVRNSGEISTWSVHVVHENDHFDYQLGDEEFILHKPALKNRGALIGSYSIVRMKDGEVSREFMNEDEILAIRDRSDGYQYAKSKGNNNNPWMTDPAEMYKKTVVRRHSKRLPMSTDLDEFLRQDDDDTAVSANHEAQRQQRQEKDITGSAEVTDKPEEKKRPSPLQGVVDISKRSKKEPPQAEEPPLPDSIPGETIDGESEDMEDRDYL